jgi:thiol-disulfide isomerase/thioredoxin
MKKCGVIVSFLLAFLALTVQRSSAEGTANTTLKIGDTKPALAFRLLDGHPAPTWSELAGNVVVVDFWATWCAPCVASFPQLNELEKQFAGQPIRFYAVTYEKAEEIKPFLVQHKLDTPVGLDNDLQTFKAFSAWAIPAIYIFDRKGTVVAVVLPNDLTKEVLQTALAGRIPQVKQAKGLDDPKQAEEYFRSLLKNGHGH